MRPPLQMCIRFTNGRASSSVMGGTTPYTYSWSGGGGTNSTATGLIAGTYTLTVTDNNGCTASASAAITQPNALSIITDSVPVASATNCNGSAWVKVSGGVSPYTYLWSGGQTTDSIFNQCKGTYCCKVTDSNKCVDSVCITITVSTGIANITSGQGKITVYPNPNNGVFTMELPVLSAKSYVTIYNLLGQAVKNIGLTGMTNQINISDQPEGIYLFRVISESGNTIGQGRLIIQK